MHFALLCLLRRIFGILCRLGPLFWVGRDLFLMSFAGNFEGNFSLRSISFPAFFLFAGTEVPYIARFGGIVSILVVFWGLIEHQGAVMRMGPLRVNRISLRNRIRPHIQYRYTVYHPICSSFSEHLFYLIKILYMRLPIQCIIWIYCRKG